MCNEHTLTQWAEALTWYKMQHTQSPTVDRASSPSLPMFSPFPLKPKPLWHLPLSISSSQIALDCYQLRSLPNAPRPSPCPPLYHVCSLPPSLPFCLLFAVPAFAPAIIFTRFIRGCGTKDREGTILGYHRLLLSPTHLSDRHMHCSFTFQIFSCCSYPKRAAVTRLNSVLSLYASCPLTRCLFIKCMHFTDARIPYY